MFDKPQSKTPFRRSFDESWVAESQEPQGRTDIRAPWTTYQPEFTAGGRKELKRYIFRAERFRITSWASSLAEAKKEAIIEADYRVALRGGKPPAGGWNLEKL